jgi:hypothetical protein
VRKTGKKGNRHPEGNKKVKKKKKPTNIPQVPEIKQALERTPFFNPILSLYAICIDTSRAPLLRPSSFCFLFFLRPCLLRFLGFKNFPVRSVPRLKANDNIHTWQSPLSPSKRSSQPVQPDTSPYLAGAVSASNHGGAPAGTDRTCRSVEDPPCCGREEARLEPVAVVGIQKATIRPVAG